MKKTTLKLLLIAFLLNVLFLSSCNKEATVSPSSNGLERSKQLKVLTDSSINLNSKGFSTNSTDNPQSQYLTINPNNNGSGSPDNSKYQNNKVAPGYNNIIATVTLSGGFATVTLSSYSQVSNGVTLHCTVFGIESDGRNVSFYVNYQQSQNGVTVASYDTEYFAHF